jgi:polynucleotide 5'-hydroxyl-kinase GRC3/NOL9
MKMRSAEQPGGLVQIIQLNFNETAVLFPLSINVPVKSSKTSLAIHVPPQWQTIDLKRISGTVMIIGASDSGKSTLARWLAGRLCRTHERVGWLDADIGQSTLGLPTTMNLAVVNRASLQCPVPRAAFFVGAVSSRGHMLPTVVGVQRLREQALASGATAIVIDTNGLVSETAGGGALKHWKIELLRPETIIALQHETELEHILIPLRHDRRFALSILPPAQAVRPRSVEQRTKRRCRLFRDYFQAATMQTFRYSDLAVYNLERAARLSLMAFQDEEGFTLALGVLMSIRGPMMEVLTTLSDRTRVASLRFGSLRLDPATGAEEAGTADT